MVQFWIEHYFFITQNNLITNVIVNFKFEGKFFHQIILNANHVCSLLGERVFRYVKQNWLKLLIFVVIPIAAAYAALHLGYVEAPKVDYESIPYVKEVMTMAGFNDESKAAVAVVRKNNVAN